MPNALWLAPHVHACALEGQVVLLDLQRNRYLAVPESTALSRTVWGWPACAGSASPSPNDDERRVLALRRLGLLLDHPVARPPAPVLPEPDRSIDPAARDEVAHRLVADVTRLAVATAMAAMQLHCRRLAAIVESHARRRLRGDGPPQAVLALAERYARCRPLVLASRDRCLLDSLALLHFLGHAKLSASWVIGVRARPFGAHAWLQCGSTVLNDQHERVRQFHPILVA